jgi:hypothetical protein
MSDRSSWQDDFALAILRAAGQAHRIEHIDLGTVYTSEWGTDGWESGCDTCGSSPAEIHVTAYWIDNDMGESRHTWDGPAEVIDLMQSLKEP